MIRIRIGRKRPVLPRVINQIPCEKCGAPSSQQFSVCALNFRYIALCSKCDIAVNEFMVRDLLQLPNADAIMSQYREKIEEYNSK
jgi:transcription elongation factor Elf1